MNIQPYNITYIKKSINGSIIGLSVLFNESYRIQNENFYSVKINNLELDITSEKTIISPVITYDKTEISPRATALIYAKIIYTIYREDDQYAG